MLRVDVTPESFTSRQEGTLPGQFGVRVTGITEGRLNSEMLLQPWMLAPNGFLHAASVVLLADSSAGYATIAHLPQGAKNFTTIELKSNFFSTAKQGLLRCEAVGDHLGRTTQVWSATVFNPDGKKMALFRCTQMILS
jgi:uncharacterized protein (TIGR00369 family)